jgi:hypothetical protein
MFVSPKLDPVSAATRSNVGHADEQPVDCTDDHEQQGDSVEVAHLGFSLSSVCPND